MPTVRLSAGSVIATLLMAACGFATATPPPSAGHGSRGLCRSLTTRCGNHEDKEATSTFHGGFVTASYKPWGTPQCSNWGNPVDNSQVHFGPFNVVSNPVGQGRYAGEFDLPAWSGGRTRCQLITPRPIGVGTDDYYTLMFYIPQRWTPGTTDFWGVQIAELNFEGLGGGGGPVSLQLHSHHLTLSLATGVSTTTMPYHQYRSNADSTGSPNLPPMYAIPPRSLQQGVWNEVIVHVHWAVDSSGAIEAWHRVLGQPTWTKTVSFSGYPTLQTWADGSMPVSTNDDIQAYRGPSTAPVSLWLDGFSRSQSFATAAAYLP